MIEVWHCISNARAMCFDIIACKTRYLNEACIDLQNHLSSHSYGLPVVIIY